MFQLSLQNNTENPFYLDKFDKSVRDQFIKNNIFYQPEKIIDNVLELENFEQTASVADKENFLKILNFKSLKNEDAGEFAICWLLDGMPVGKSQSKIDVRLKDNKTISVKHLDIFNSKLKFGRVSSSPSYKELMSFWNFYVTFLCQDNYKFNSTKISKKDIDSNTFYGSSTLLTFLQTADISLFNDDEKKEIKFFLDKILSFAGPLNEKIKKYINSIIVETLKEDLHYMVIINHHSTQMKVLDFKKDINDFYEKYFSSLEGAELYMNIKPYLDDNNF